MKSADSPLIMQALAELNASLEISGIVKGYICIIATSDDDMHVRVGGDTEFRNRMEVREICEHCQKAMKKN